jgi:transposase
MEVVFARCAGIDVHKRSVVVCRLTPGLTGTRDATSQVVAVTQTFGTTTDELLRLSDWLAEGGCTHVGLESTGEFWKPVFNLLEGTFTVWLLNAQHIKAVPGRKTDVKDAQWIAELLRHGLVRPSFIPPQPQRELRDLTRYRIGFVRERATLVNRVQKVLESTNLKLSSVVSNVVGVSSRAILAALLAGEEDPAVLANLAKGQLRKKRPQLEQALQGRLRPHQSFVLTELLAQIDALEETVARFDAQIRDACTLHDDADRVVALLDTIPGIAEATAQLLVAEIGTDMHRFSSPAALAAWAGLAPGNNESAGRQRSGRTRKGNVWLRTALVQAAQAAAHMKHTALAARYRRIATRRGAKKAVIALAHTLLVIAYYVILRREPYHELGEDYLQRLDPQTRARRLVRQLSHLGFDVELRSHDLGAAIPVAAPLATVPPLAGT